MSRTCAVWATALLLVAPAARAGPNDLRFGQPPAASPFAAAGCEVSFAPEGGDSLLHIRWDSPPADASFVHRDRPGFDWSVDLGLGGEQAPQGTVRRPAAVEYSHAYEVRRKIHKYASIATVPLFVAETWLGQSLYNNPGSSESKRGAHGAVATSIGILFGVNSVTGMWNLIEGRDNPAGRTRRTVHGVMMLAADAGFVATGLLAPHEREHETAQGPVLTERGGNPATHRAVALSSMGVALASYLMMLIWRD